MGAGLLLRWRGWLDGAARDPKADVVSFLIRETGIERHGRAVKPARSPGAADARQHIPLPEDAHQASTYFDEQSVPFHMPEDVVDMLEAIQIDKEHGEPVVAAGRLRNRVPQEVRHHRSVREPRQWVMSGRVREGQLNAAPVGHVGL